jgi:hypothetical protein
VHCTLDVRERFERGAEDSEKQEEDAAERLRATKTKKKSERQREGKTKGTYRSDV